MIERSKNVTLDIVWSHEYGNGCSLENELGHIHRIVTLAITEESWHAILPPLSEDLTSPASLLTSLKLSSVGYETVCTLLQNFLGNHTPRLTKAAFSSPVSIKTSLLRSDNLTTLSVDYRDCDLTVDREVSIEFPHYLPNLKTLIQVNAFPIENELAFKREWHWSSLRCDFHLVLHGIDINLLRNLGNISQRSPPRFNLIIQTLPIDFSVVQDEISQLHASFAKCYDGRNNPYLFTYLEIGVFGFMAYVSEICDESGCAGCATCEAGSYLTFEATYGFRQNDGQQVALERLPLLDQAFWNVLPFEGVRSLDFIQD
ncbi:hypothetical protein PQX77_015578 [Marasmius sp. AFHP31]|nr:hypothetical protein PQX77_015578 [Marasmius sp. AFHP31]